MNKQQLIQAWRDFEAQVNAEMDAKPFDLVETFDRIFNSDIKPTPAATAGQLLVEYGDAAAKYRFEDRMANGLSIVGDEVYRLLTEAS